MAHTPLALAGRIPRPVLASVLINGGLPLALYALLSPHMSQLHTVLLIALVPLAESLVTFARHRRVDAFGLFILVTLLLGAGIVLLGGSARLILVREQILTGAAGLALLASLLLPRPFMFYLMLANAARRDLQGKERIHARWAEPAFRRTLRLMTLVFGLGVVAEAAINITLAYTVAIPTFLAVSPLVRYGIAGGLVLWLVVYVRKSKQSAGYHPLALR